VKIAWILNPLTLYGVLAAALVAGVALFFAVKAEIRAVRRRFEESGKAAAVRLKETELAIERLREAMAETGEPPPAPLLPGLNLTRRAQAVRMHQRGEPAATIAAALRAPRNEIELLIRLQEMQRRRAS
jgi:hypothetical protein